MKAWIAAATILCFAAASEAEDTFTPITKESEVPTTAIDLWKDYDPRKEPLDVEVVKTWDEEGVVCKYIFYTVCTFKGKPSRVSAFYTYPKGGSNLPAFVWAHGGGQCAKKLRGYHFAQRGYAVIDINWGGKDGALEEGVSENTDWGALDPTQGPNHYKKSPRTKMHKSVVPDEYTIDTVRSPRNHPTFLRALSGRRAITFLEQQPEVDPIKIGFTGFSVGGEITSRVAIDKRLKAIVPIVGGTGFRDEPIFGYPGKVFPGGRAGDPPALAAQNYWPLATCPVLFVSCSQDFNAIFDKVAKAMKLLPHNEWRISQGMHSNHSPGPDQWLAFEYWFDHYLKGEGTGLPESPRTRLENIDGTDMMRFTATPDDVKNVKHLVVYYSYEPNTQLRFHRNARATRKGDRWIARIKRREDRPLYVFAHVTYGSRSGQMEEVFTGSSSKTEIIESKVFSDAFSIISNHHVLLPDRSLQAPLPGLNDPKRRFDPVFEDFKPGWESEWEWAARKNSMRTFKFNDTELKFPAAKKMAIRVNNPGGDLTLRVRAESNGHFNQEMNEGSRGAGFTFSKTVSDSGLRDIVFGLSDLQMRGAKNKLTSWHNISRFRIEIATAHAELGLRDVLKRIHWVD